MNFRLIDYTNKKEDVILTPLSLEEAKSYSLNRFGTFTDYRAKDFAGQPMEDWFLLTIKNKRGAERLAPWSQLEEIIAQFEEDLAKIDYSNKKEQESNIAIQQRPMPRKDTPRVDKCYDSSLISLVDEHNGLIYDLFSEIYTLKLEILKLNNKLREK